MKHNFVESLLGMGGGIQTFHYESVIKHFSGCPITLLRGPPESGKSTLILAILGMCGCQVSSYYVKGTNAFFIDCSSESTLPYGIDDPLLKGTAGSSKTNLLDVRELVVDLYNGAKSANALKGSRRPRSAPIIASNFDLKDDSR